MYGCSCVKHKPCFRIQTAMLSATKVAVYCLRDCLMLLTTVTSPVPRNLRNHVHIRTTNRTSLLSRFYGFDQRTLIVQVTSILGYYVVVWSEETVLDQGLTPILNNLLKMTVRHTTISRKRRRSPHVPGRDLLV